jgi:hypothetical protein
MGVRNGSGVTVSVGNIRKEENLLTRVIQNSKGGLKR